MNRPARPWRARLFNRRVALAVLCLLLVIAAVVTLRLVGLRLVGQLARIEHGMRAHAAGLLAWRLLLYATLARNWWSLRKRLRQRDPLAGSHHRMLRTEIATAIIIVLLEGSQWL